MYVHEACGTYRTSSILVMMFSAYERSRSRVTRSRTLSWSSLVSSTSATVRPILRFCLKYIKRMIYWAWVDNAFKNLLFLVLMLKPRTFSTSCSCALIIIIKKSKFKLPEIFKVLLDVGEQRVLQCLNMLSVYVLWDQFCPPPVCKHKQKHTNIQYTVSRDYRWDVRQHSTMYCFCEPMPSTPLEHLISLQLHLKCKRLSKCSNCGDGNLMRVTTCLI